MSKLLFVVHRYGFPGGSEYNVQRLAEEALRQGHEVTVLSDEHTGNLNGVRVTSDKSEVDYPWDMIFVHGSCSTQDYIHYLSEGISKISPIYYLLVEPPKTPVALNGMKHAKWIGWGTSFDLDFIKSQGFEDKSHKFYYGIEDCLGDSGFKERYGITTQRMFLSAGGFWPHKRHNELAEAFKRAEIPDTTLVLLGYDNRNGTMPRQSKDVAVILGASKQDVYDAMYEADLYILNSASEGYGLVLLEAMSNLCPWIATDIAAAHDLHKLGHGEMVYNTDDELSRFMKNYELPAMDSGFAERLTRAESYVLHYHDIGFSVRNLLSVLK